MIKNFFNVAGADAVKRIAEWIRHKFYTKSEIDEMFSAGAKYEVVDELPSTGVEGTIYLVPLSTSPSGDIYDEYIYVDGDFEKIGTTKADLANVVRVPTTGTAVGDTTHPVYVDADGEATAGSQYAGGTKLTLNGADKGADSATAYAPTAGGTSGQYLKSNGNGNAPSWETMDTAPTENSTNPVTSGGIKTALDGKQASVTITTKTDDAGDNDKVILQANGVTDTTTFVRRSLSNLLNWFRSKLDSVYFKRGDITTQIGSNYLYNLAWDNKFYCADVRFHAESHIYNIESGEEVTGTGMPVVKQFFDGNFAHYYSHPQTGEKQVVTITAASQTSAGYLFTYGNGRLLVCFYSSKTPNAISLRYKQRNSDTWMTANFSVSSLATNIYEAIIPWSNSTYINTFEITIEGKTNAEVAYPGTSIAQIVLLCPENGQFNPSQQAIVNKYATAQRIFGDVEMAKIIKTDGTSSQVLLANGDVMSLPVPINKGGTGATTAIGAEYNILNQVADISTTLSDTRKIALCNQTKSASNGVFRWIALSNVWTWIKTHFDSSPTSGSGNGITSGGVYSALEEKVNLQPDFTAQQISYSAGNVGKWQKVLRFPEGADLVINMKKTAMGSDSTSTLWFSSSSMGDSYTSLFGNHSVRFVHDGWYVFLVLACKKSTNEPTESYTFQIAHSSVPMSDIVAVTDASPITATPKEPNIVYRAPITTGAVSFNVTSGAGSVAMANHNDFLGNMTSEATNGVVVTMSGATEGQIYRFVFTRNIEGGVTFKQSNVAYCTIQGDVNAGDTITLTAVSNTENGWLYEQESAGIKSSDGSINVEYEGGTADLSLNLPPDVVRNIAYSDADGHDKMAIGYNTQASGLSATAIGRNTQANGYQSASYGYFSQANGYISAAFGSSAKASATNAVALGVIVNAEAQGATAIGVSATANGVNSLSIGESTEANADSSMAVGYLAKAVGSYSVALGCNAKAGYPSGNSEYPRYEVGRFTAVDFVEGGETKKYRFVDYGSSVTITLNGDTYTLTPPNANLKFFIVVNSAVAARIFRAVNGYAQINGTDIYINNIDSYDIVTDALAGNYYALWLVGVSSNFPSSLDSFSFLAYYKGTNSDKYHIAVGNEAVAIYKGSLAIGSSAKAVASGQIVIGAGAIPNESDKLLIGNGRIEGNAKKNILTIDSNERLKVCSYVGETQTIEMNQQTGSLNITNAVYRIRWDDTGTVELTLNTSGCVEGQRVTIFAETNDVQIRFTSFLIPQGRFADFMFIAGAWRPYSGIGEVPTA